MVTNISLRTRTGTEVAVFDLVQGLKAAGQKPSVYSPYLGAVAKEIEALGIPVFSRLIDIPHSPDFIHGHHYLETLDALRHFKGVPGLFVCHDRLACHDLPPRHRRLRCYAAVDENCRERLLEPPWMDPRQVVVIPNGVDTRRFKRRRSLPDRPRRALVFSNYAGPGTHLEVIRSACLQEGIDLDAAGAGVANYVNAPEDVLPGYDLVFAKARCALEAMAVGSAVILCDTHGLGPAVTRTRLEELRRWNFGMRLLTGPLDPAEIVTRIREYDPDDASEVCEYIRQEANLERVIAEYLRVSSRVLEEKGDLQLDDPVLEASPTRRCSCCDQLLLRLKIVSTPERVIPREDCALRVRLTRWTRAPVATESPWPPLLAYRWFDEPIRVLAVKEGVRSVVQPPLPWGRGREYGVRVIAPGLPGRYRLRITLVQEQWHWLDVRLPRVLAETRITVDPNSR